MQAPPDHSHSIQCACRMLARWGRYPQAGLVQGSQVALIDARLYVPKSWIDDPKRCDEAKIPAVERVLRSKSELALRMVREARSHGVRYAWVAADGG